MGTMKLNIKNLYNVIIFLSPFFIIGFRFLGYPISIAFVFLIVLTILLISKRYFHANLLFSLLLFLGWSLLTSLFRISIFQYLPSLISLVLVTLPLVAKKEILKLDIRKIDKLLLITYFIIVIYWSYQYIAYYLRLPTFDNLLPLTTGLKFFWTSFVKIPRFSSFFSEPAHLVVYILTLYILVDRRLIEYGSKFNIFIKISGILIILFTVSLKGFGILIIYYVVSYYKKAFSILITFKISKSVFNTVLIAFFTFVIISFLYFVQMSKGLNQIVDSFIIRFEKVEKVIAGTKVDGSEAIRINVVKLGSEYLQEEGLLKFFYGEGFAQHDIWVLNNALDRYPDGKINNVYIIILLSTGIVGLIFFLIFIFTVIKSYNIDVSLAIVFLLFLFFSGYLIIYLNWISLLLFSIYSVKR